MTCEKASKYKVVALNRLKDAVALYEEGRYLGTIYMAGYVIEIGVRSEFYRLSSASLNERMIADILKELYKPPSLPLTLLGFLNFIVDKEKQKIESLRSIKVKAIVQGRIIDDDSSSKYHNITKYLETLQEWKKLFSEPPFSLEDYQIDKTHGWDTSLRYEDEAKVNNINIETDEKARSAILMSIKFLKKIVLNEGTPEHDAVLKYENKINLSNKEADLSNIDNERR